MTIKMNAFGQPVGEPVPEWQARPLPAKPILRGCYCRVEPLDAVRHGAQLYAVLGSPAAASNWTYLSREPPTDLAEYQAWLSTAARSEDPRFFAIIELINDTAVGIAAYLRIDAANGVIEVGHLNFSSHLQRTPAATEAMFLLMQHAFDDLGYRRYEWKCDSHNAPSRVAARRLGFRYEGEFRQAMVYKGRNRDTAWFSILDREWPALKAVYERWLAAENFAADGSQLSSLSQLTASLHTTEGDEA